MKSEWLLLPLETPEDQRRLLSMNLTAIWISEGIEISFDLIGPDLGALRSLPVARRRRREWYGIVIDTNMPTEGTPWAEAMTNPPPDWDVYIQRPPAWPRTPRTCPTCCRRPRSPKMSVDDIRRIARGRLYLRPAVPQPRNSAWVTRYVLADYGPDSSGSAVFSGTFRASFHIVAELAPITGRPLIVGQDFGRDSMGGHPAEDHRGRPADP